MNLPVRNPDMRLVTAVTAILWSLAAYNLASVAAGRGVLFASLRWTGAACLGTLAAVFSLGLLGVAFSGRREGLLSLVKRIQVFLGPLKAVNLLLFLIPFGFLIFLLLLPGNEFMRWLGLRLALFWSASLVGAVCLKAYRSQLDWATALAMAWLLGGALYRAAAFIPDVSTYPFSLGWSEASRYYYASLYFAENLYGKDILLSPLHPSRYLLQAIPFLAGRLPVWFHRLWQVILWLGTSSAVIYGLARRVLPSQKTSGNVKENSNSRDRFPKVWLLPAAATAWMFLFLFQGPVYYHLLVIPALILWLFDARCFWRSMLVVLLASAWAGISRLNWFPVPGLLAATLYFLETPVGSEPTRSLLTGQDPQDAHPETGRASMVPQGTKSGEFTILTSLRYLLKPFSWVFLGSLVAFAFQTIYALWSGGGEGAFTSSFTSDLLWYRLLPNPTFPLGVLPAVLLVTGPLLILVFLGARRLERLRQLSLWSILAVLFIGGVVVSVKIGGGSNLHNLDAFLVLLMVSGSYIFFQRVVPHSVDPTSSAARMVPPGSLTWLLTGLVVLIPVVYALPALGPLEFPDREKTGATLERLQTLVEQATDRGGEVLFISERHLLTFGILTGVPLIGEYETVFLMEMAMAGNQAYLGQFYRDIGRQRFDLIVSDPLHNTLKGRVDPFGEENDVWVMSVARPILSSYQRAEAFKGFGFEVLEPKR